MYLWHVHMIYRLHSVVMRWRCMLVVVIRMKHHLLRWRPLRWTLLSMVVLLLVVLRVHIGVIGARSSLLRVHRHRNIWRRSIIMHFGAFFSLDVNLFDLAAQLSVNLKIIAKLNCERVPPPIKIGRIKNRLRSAQST